MSNCGALAFKPSFKVSTNAKISKASGASLQVELSQPAHEANIRSVFVQLPVQLPSRLTTLQKACPEATFAANPSTAARLGAEVGAATVTTPVLPGQLTGSGLPRLPRRSGVPRPGPRPRRRWRESDPDREHETSRKGSPASTFAAIPDVPVSSFDLSLPIGPHSALTANGNLCTTKLIMPTVITAQSGAKLEQSTRISVGGCGVRILSRRVRGHRLLLRVRTLVAGRVSVKGKDLRTVSRRLSKAATVTLTIPLTRGGLKALRRHRRLKVRVGVAFVPKQRGLARSSASAAVTFRR